MSRMKKRRRDRGGWTLEGSADLTGHVAVVTGANSGIGYETARALSRLDAEVILACRDLVAAKRAAADIRREVPQARLTIVELDLADLRSISRAADRILETTDRLDLLINNGGVMRSVRALTVDGFESDLGTNFLGHFALTGHLVELLTATAGSRVVTVSSITHRRGRIHFDDLTLEHGFTHEAAYAQSKLANLMFAYALGRRLRALGGSTISVSAHPGGTRTSVLRDRTRGVRLVYNPALRPVTSLFTQDATRGALPTLRAALDPEVSDGDFYGPGGRFELVGAPVKVRSAGRARDEDAQERLWSIAEELTAVAYPAVPLNDAPAG